MQLKGNPKLLVIFLKNKIFSSNTPCAGCTRPYVRSQGEGCTPDDGLYEEAPTERGIFFRLQVYERVGKSVIWVCKMTY